MLDILNDFENMVAERMNKPVLKLNHNNEFRRRKEDYDMFYNSLCQKLSTVENELKHKLEDLIIESDTIHSSYETLYFIVGFLDGVKFSSKFD